MRRYNVSAHKERMEEIPPEIEELFDDANGELAIGELPAAIEKYRQCVEQASDLF